MKGGGGRHPHRALDFWRRQTSRQTEQQRQQEDRHRQSFGLLQKQTSRQTDRAKTAGGQTQTELRTTEANLQTTFQS